MSSLQLGHPEDEKLLRFADGELSAGEAAEVRGHLEACWQCRMELGEIQKVVGRCVEYRKEMQAYLPEPPAPWVDLYRRMAETDTVLEGSLLARAARAAGRLLAPRRWVPAVVATALLVAIYFQIRHTPSVEAAALLHRATVAADGRHEMARRIHIRTREHHLTRVLGAAPQSVADRASSASIEKLFVAAHYNWEDPLSARSYESWRGQLREKQDEVSQDSESYQIRTRTQASEIREATLRLHAGDLRPVEERLEFRNQEWVEITEMPEVSAPTSVAEGRPEPKAAPEPEKSRAAEAPQPQAMLATAGEELQVMAALHQVGADLGDPVEVKRSGSQIRVIGVGVAPERQRRIEQALAQMPYVVLEFSQPAVSRPAEPQAPPVEVEAPRQPARLQARVEQQLGGHAYFEQLASQVLDMSDTIMSRAYALRRLAERFPPPVEANLSAAERGVLRRLQQEHAAALARQTAELERLLHPVLAPLGGTAASEARRDNPAGTWQSATEDLFQAARRVETLAAAMFGGAPAPAAEAQLPAELLASLAELQNRAQMYERLPAAAVDEQVK